MNKRKLGFLAVGATFLVLVGFLTQSEARVNVNIGIGIPAYTFPAPPSLVMIPGTYVYAVPDVDVEILFYHGYWYRPFDGRWYRARYYNGPWVSLAPARVPGVLVSLSPGYRHFPSGYRHIPYGEFHRNWRRWERDRYWDRDDQWREGRRDDHRERGRRD